MSIEGRTYLERGKPVIVMRQWRARTAPEFTQRDGWQFVLGDLGKKRSGPRNVLIMREDGEMVIRPFRGLRRYDGPVTVKRADDQVTTEAPEGGTG